MPVRWTPENDQLLLLKIIETHDLTVDTKKVAGAWPGDDADSIPTPRAISERLQRVKTLAKNKTGNVNSPATPANRKRGGGTGSKPTSKRSRTAGKGKSGIVKKELPGSPTPGVKKEEDGSNPMMGMANGTDGIEDVFTQQTPPKRVRTAPAIPMGMIIYDEDTDNDDIKYESSISEFQPADDIENEGDEVMEHEMAAEECA